MFNLDDTLRANASNRIKKLSSPQKQEVSSSQMESLLPVDIEMSNIEPEVKVDA
jgi:hypothetical protein